MLFYLAGEDVDSFAWFKRTQSTGYSELHEP